MLINGDPNGICETLQSERNRHKNKTKQASEQPSLSPVSPFFAAGRRGDADTVVPYDEELLIIVLLTDGCELSDDEEHSFGKRWASFVVGLETRVHARLAMASQQGRASKRAQRNEHEMVCGRDWIGRASGRKKRMRRVRFKF